LSNGKVTVGEETLTIKGLLGQTKVIQRRKISNIDKTGNILHGLWLCLWILPALQGIKMLMGNVQVTVKHSYDEEFKFWMKKGEYKKLVNLL
tara:strand:+ start:1477 stop:1752 length:276 start_codon:yes stop_codon:yes gene_type:complete